MITRLGRDDQRHRVSTHHQRFGMPDLMAGAIGQGLTSTKSRAIDPPHLARYWDDHWVASRGTIDKARPVRARHLAANSEERPATVPGPVLTSERTSVLEMAVIR